MFCLLFDDHNSYSLTVSRRQEGLFCFFMPCVPFHGPEVACRSNSLFCVLGHSGLNLDASHSGRMRLQKCFRFSWSVFLAYRNLLTIFFPYP